MEWQPIEQLTSEAAQTGTYIVANDIGQVAPMVRGIIQNNVGTTHDWDWGSKITDFQPLPPPPKE